jgi:hypothetical protein
MARTLCAMASASGRSSAPRPATASATSSGGARASASGERTPARSSARARRGPTSGTRVRPDRRRSGRAPSSSRYAPRAALVTPPPKQRAGGARGCAGRVMGRAGAGHAANKGRAAERLLEGGGESGELPPLEVRGERRHLAVGVVGGWYGVVSEVMSPEPGGWYGAGRRRGNKQRRV